MHVEPQKAKQRANKHETKTRQIDLSWIKRNPTKRGEWLWQRSTCQPIQPIGKVHGVRFATMMKAAIGTYHQPSSISTEQPGKIHVRHIQHDISKHKRPKRQNHLGHEFRAGAHSFAFAFAADTFPIIHCAKNGKPNHHDHRHKHGTPDPHRKPIKAAALSKPLSNSTGRMNITPPMVGVPIFTP